MASRALMKRLLLTISLMVTFLSSSDQKLQSAIDDKPEDFPTASNGFRAQDFNVQRRASADADIARDVQEALPNIPVTFCKEKKHENRFYKNRSCASFPSLGNVDVNNLYYQMFRTNHATMYLFGAYFDTRSRSPVGRSVRLLGMVERVSLQELGDTYCHIWYANSNEPSIVKATYFTMWGEPRQVVGYYYPFLATCPLPQDAGGQIPIFVSMVQNRCDSPRNSLRVIYNKSSGNEKRGRFAVCVRIMDFLQWDQSARIVEWIELMRLLGAEKVFFYPFFVHENVTKVFRYYAQRGMVEETPITLAGSQPNFPGLAHLYAYDPEVKNSFQNWMNELISLNDCFYKNMYGYDYIALLDIDEVIMPMKEVDWRTLMNVVSAKATKHPVDAYSFKPVHFRLSAEDNSRGREENLYLSSASAPFEDTPSYMYMLQRVKREEEYWMKNFKTFFNTETVEVVHNHIALKCLGKDKCATYVVDEKDAQLQHYHVRGKAKSLVTDTTIWRYKRTLIDRCLAVFYELGYFKGPRPREEGKEEITDRVGF